MEVMEVVMEVVVVMMMMEVEVEVAGGSSTRRCARPAMACWSAARTLRRGG